MPSSWRLRHHPARVGARLEDTKRVARPVEPDERARRCAQRLEFERRCLVFPQRARERRQAAAFVSATSTRLCHALEGLPELVDVADFEGLPIRLAEVWEAVDRRGSPAARAGRRRVASIASFRALALRFDEVWIEPSALSAYSAACADPTISNGSRSRKGISEDRAARPQRVPHADFVPDIWVVQE